MSNKADNSQQQQTSDRSQTREETQSNHLPEPVRILDDIFTSPLAVPEAIAKTLFGKSKS